MVFHPRFPRSTRLALSVAAVFLTLGCDDSTGPRPQEGEVFEGDWTASVHGSVMTLQIGEFVTLGSEGRILWDTYAGRLSCSSRLGEDPPLRCSIPAGLDGPESGPACVPDGRRLPYLEITAADSSTIRAVVGGEQHRFANPCVDDPQLSWEPAVEVEFRRE